MKLAFHDSQIDVHLVLKNIVAAQVTSASFIDSGGGSAPPALTTLLDPKSVMEASAFDASPAPDLTPEAVELAAFSSRDLAVLHRAQAFDWGGVDIHLPEPDWPL